ncbi:MAG: L-threonylcarbamoyladenylate synthase [Pseudonocardiaceae bacterium]
MPCPATGGSATPETDNQLRNSDKTSPARDIARALTVLRSGGVAGLPTDTVYGLAGLASHPGVSERILALKGRPSTLPLPVLVSGLDQAATLVQINETAMVLIQSFWPGGLTLVLPAVDAGVSTAHLGAQGDGRDRTIGVRCPDHPVPIALCLAGGPLVTTSANLHGGLTPPTAAGVEQIFGPQLAIVIDGGTCEAIASTVVDIRGQSVRLLRAGAVPWEAVTNALGEYGGRSA